MKIFAIVGESIQQVGGTCPIGWIKMSSERPDNKSVATPNGTWEYPTTGTTISDREAARLVMNPIRDTFLNRLSGIAMFSGNVRIKEECSTLRSALLDITKDPAFLAAETHEDMEYALKLAYKTIASQASQDIRNVFRELEVL